MVGQFSDQGEKPRPLSVSVYSGAGDRQGNWCWWQFIVYIFTTDKMFDYHCFKCCLDFMTYSISGPTLLPHGDNSSLVSRSPRKLVQRISFQNSSSSPGNQSVTFSSGSGTHYEIWNWKISVIWSSMVSSILRQWKIPYFVFLRRELSNICLCLPESKAGWSKIYYLLYTENELSCTVC